jgi:hypothetical protein
MRKRKSLEERFWPKVNKNGPRQPHMPTPCWEWTGFVNWGGYGQLRDADKRRPVGAHRVSWALANGREAPDGVDVMHACDNRKCVRPEHLSVGSRLDNVRDMISKGRAGASPFLGGRYQPSTSQLARGIRHGSVTHPECCPRGEQHGQAKLNALAITSIRRQSAAGASDSDLAIAFGVSRPTIWAIKRKQTWKHVS